MLEQRRDTEGLCNRWNQHKQGHRIGITSEERRWAPALLHIHGVR